jgi:hypothetical protein
MRVHPATRRREHARRETPEVALGCSSPGQRGSRGRIKRCRPRIALVGAESRTRVAGVVGRGSRVDVAPGRAVVTVPTLARIVQVAQCCGCPRCPGSCTWRSAAGAHVGPVRAGSQSHEVAPAVRLHPSCPWIPPQGIQALGFHDPEAFCHI